MSAVALTRRAFVEPEPRAAELKLFRRGPRNLAELIDTAWAGLLAEAPVACPICDGRMDPRPTATGVAGGTCRSCGSELS